MPTYDTGDRDKDEQHVRAGHTGRDRQAQEGRHDNYIHYTYLMQKLVSIRLFILHLYQWFLCLQTHVHILLLTLTSDISMW
jgi:hypothetical protein